ncbi:F0F1 ATP synthase subunit B family protein [Croceibacterium aestuarii]|uniref:F0F1 ATP synthase subunit B family protein n=1 Tax=Croceibacterium aestuarii TaxID=3064139 RepID=UPI00272E7CA8|nr:ATPase [Croceibacterium sp. D39]
MPQLAQLALVYQSQWFWLLLVLGVIYFFVGRGIVPKVEETVDQRDARIQADLAEAERLREEADRAEEAWRATINEAHAEAQAVTARAKEDAGKDAAKRVAAADKRLAKKLDEAAGDLDEARRAALTEIEAMAAEATREIVAKLTGSKVDETTARSAVAEALSRA